MENETTKIPQKKVKGGKGMMGPDTGKKFSKDYQPSAASKKAGWAKKRKGQELVQAILQEAFKGMKDSKLKQQAAEYFGIAQKNVTVEMMLHFRQAEKAIQKADTQAYSALLDRAFGKPKDKMELTGKDGRSIQITNKITHVLTVKRCGELPTS